MRWMKEQGVGESRVGRREDEQDWGEGMGKRVSKKVCVENAKGRERKLGHGMRIEEEITWMRGGRDGKFGDVKRHEEVRQGGQGEGLGRVVWKRDGRRDWEKG